MSIIKKSKPLTKELIRREFQTAMALMSIVPLLGFTYLIAHIAGLDSLVELRGLMALSIIVVSLLGVLLGRSLVSDLVQELGETNAELAKASETKSAFLANVAHEAGSPLGTLRGHLEALKAGYRGAVSEDAKYALDASLKQTLRLVRMVNDLLDIAKIEKGKYPIELQRTDLSDVVAEAVELAAGNREGRKILYHADDQQKIVESADKERLIQVLLNLLKNADKYSPENREIAVSVSRIGETYEIAVADRGDGIPDEMKDKIFEPFMRHTTRKVGGVGLGLAISRHIVAEHGGRLWVENNPGGGSVFKFQIPIQAANKI